MLRKFPVLSLHLLDILPISKTNNPSEQYTLNNRYEQPNTG